MPDKNFVSGKGVKMSLAVTPGFFVRLLPLFLLLSVASGAYARGSSAQIHVKGVSCPFCVYGIEKKLKQIPGIESIGTDYKKSWKRTPCLFIGKQMECVEKNGWKRGTSDLD